MQAVIFSLLAFCSTYLGGSVAIKLKDKLHPIMAFAAGVMLGVVCFDIFPEIMELTKAENLDIAPVMVALVFGFLLFHILEKTILIHHVHEDDYREHKHPQVGILSALALAGHSFLDGISIGLGFQISGTVGMLMAIAVISHGFVDGMNSATLMITNKNDIKKVKQFLLVHAAAPILGAISTLFFKLPENWLVLYLGFFAGFFLYIGASDILPEAHSQRSSWKLIGLTVLGAVFIFAITRLV